MPEETSMAHSPVDPASLQGEALRRWYLRSPNDIEGERQRAQEQRYEAFVAGIRSQSQTQVSALQNVRAPAAPEYYGVSSETTEPNGWRGGQLSSAHRGAGYPTTQYRLASGAGQPAPGLEGIGYCVTCHGRVPPPPLFPFPFRPGEFPSFRDTPSPPPSGSRKRRLPQCDVQYDNDSEICRPLSTAGARGKCWESASKRRA